MKKFIEICEEITRERDKIKTTHADNLKKFINDFSLWERKTDNEIKKRCDELSEKAHKEEQKNTMHKIIIEILKDNAKNALLSEKIAAICEIWNSYAGKAYGTKTAEKIREEIKQKTNIFVSIGHKWSDHTYINFCNSYHDPINPAMRFENFEYIAKTQSTTEENKIKPIDANLFRPYICGEYVENPKEHAKKLLQAHDEARQAQKKLEQLTQNYNALTRGKIDYINARETIYKFSI